MRNHFVCALAAALVVLSVSAHPVGRRDPRRSAFDPGPRTYHEIEDCARPGAYLKEVLDAVNRRQEISQVLAALDLPACATVGANQSHSLQHSLTNGDPRFFIKTRCRILTITPYSDSLELALTAQRAEIDLPIATLPPGATAKSKRDEAGVILATMGPFPRGERVLTAGAGPDPVLNAWNYASTSSPARSDTKGCTGCHVETSVTKGPLGLKTIAVGEETVEAVVSPFMLGPTDEPDLPAYCIPRDVELLYFCQCTPGRDPACAAIASPAVESRRRVEACARLEAILRLRPCQNSQIDPTRVEVAPGTRGKCFSDGWKPPAALAARLSRIRSR